MGERERALTFPTGSSSISDSHFLQGYYQCLNITPLLPNTEFENNEVLITA